MAVTNLQRLAVLAVCLYALPSQAQNTGHCDQQTFGLLTQKYSPPQVDRICGIANSPGGQLPLSAKCTTRVATCMIVTPAAPGTPCYCKGPRGPDPGTISPSAQ